MFIDADGNKHYLDDSKETAPSNTGKEKTYTSRTGLTFWFDGETNTVWTNRKDVFFHVYRSKDRDEPGVVFILHIEGRSIAFSETQAGFIWGAPDKREDGSYFWKLSSIGGSYQTHELTIDNPQYRDYALTNSNKFVDIQQQNYALTLVEDILVRHVRGWNPHARGEELRADVTFSEELTEKISHNEFVEENI